MRGFGKQARDKVPPRPRVGTYTEALYPPRAYHAHHLPPGCTPGTTPVLPSVDPDTVCQPRPDAVTTGGGGGGARAGPYDDGGSRSDDPRPPGAISYFGCYVGDGTEAVAFAHAATHAEPLNAFHYGPVVAAAGGGAAGVAALAAAFDLPPELVPPYAAALGTSTSASSVPAVPAGTLRRWLTVRPQRTPAPPRPMRRGGKVVMPVPAAAAETLAPRHDDGGGGGGGPHKRQRTEGPSHLSALAGADLLLAGLTDGPDDGAERQRRGGRSGGGGGGGDGEGSGGDEDNAHNDSEGDEDELSVGFHQSDDDDANFGDDGDGGSDGGDDDYS